MSFVKISNYRNRIADVEYEINKEQNKIFSLEDNLKQRHKDKEFTLQNKIKWLPTFQLGIEQAELQIKIHEAIKDKLINELKFLRLELQEALDEKNKSS